MLPPPEHPEERPKVNLQKDKRRRQTKGELRPPALQAGRGGEGADGERGAAAIVGGGRRVHAEGNNAGGRVLANRPVQHA